MKKDMPRTPFSTALSGSARETELRLRNIFSGPKRRPPLLFLVLAFSLCLLCGNLVSCQVAEAEKAGPGPESSGAPEISAPARAAYVKVLEDMFDNGILPDGTEFQVDYSVESIADNQFVIADVDGDGREELVILFTTTMHAGYRGWVLDYDAETESVYIQFEGYPSLTFYSNGAIEENDSHAQGSWADNFWPHSIYRYLPESDRYELAGHVGAWEKSVSDENQGNLPPFPSELDTSGAGILYYITPAEDFGENFTGYSTDPVDQSVYEAWLRPWLGDAQPLTLNYLPLASDSIQEAGGREIAASDTNPGLARTPDLNSNGVPETFQLMELADGGLSLTVWENGQCIRTELGDDSLDRTALFLCTLEGRDYLLRYHPDERQGVYSYYYSLIDLSGEFEEWPQSGAVTFDINFGTPYHKPFDRPAIAAFMDEINELLSHSVLLFNTYPELEETFFQNGRLYDSLSWLDACEGFSRDEKKTLEDNLEAVQRILMARQKISVGRSSALPITEPVELLFASGAGAWGTVVILNPDGTFTGDYSDADLDTVYVCQFHGKFGEIMQVSDTAYTLVLEELALDTKYPVGKEWNEDGFHYISSEPYGFDDGDAALKPGAQFMFYTPEATGHAPGTDLYGAVDFQSWMHGYQEFSTAADTLGCYGLNNLTTGQGFFS